MEGKKILPLKFDTWTSFTTDRTGFTQPLFGFAELLIDNTRQSGLKERCQSSICPCCQTNIIKQSYEYIRDMTGTQITYYACPACGYWRRKLDDSVSFSEYVIPSIKEFNTQLETPSLIHLTTEIKKKPSILYDIDPYKFEKYVGSVFKDLFECEVYHVGRSGDDGVDLIMVVKEEPMMIQVKRRSSPEAVEGVNVVKLLFASSFGQMASRGAIVTTANRFSRNAKEWSKTPALVDIGFECQLIDFNSLMSMINVIADKNDSPPWYVHKTRKNDSWQPSKSESSNWVIKSYMNHDYLIHNEKGQLKAFLFDHRSLENCIMITGEECKLQEFIETWTSSKPIENSELNFTFYRNDRDLEREINVPFDIADKLTKRWIEMYPNRVIDATP